VTATFSYPLNSESSSVQAFPIRRDFFSCRVEIPPLRKRRKDASGSFVQLAWRGDRQRRVGVIEVVKLGVLVLRQGSMRHRVRVRKERKSSTLESVDDPGKLGKLGVSPEEMLGVWRGVADCVKGRRAGAFYGGRVQIGRKGLTSVRQ
jgi:hypothetical protein